jgi:hypothetical protein
LPLVAALHSWRVNKPRASLFIGTMLATLVACGPGGPGYKELASNPVFSTPMPGATAGRAGGEDPHGGIEGPTYGFATRLFGIDADTTEVLDWHRTRYEGDGWTPTRTVPIGMFDGYFFDYGWRRGDLIVGLGFPRRDLVQNPGDDVAEARTVYEVFITYGPNR